jgi:hypothetical protein
MAKTVKGARIRLRRSAEAGSIPTIPPNEDHTTGWKETDIYIGELFINTSITTPGIWFRDSSVSGITQIATLDKITNKLSADQIPSVSVIMTNVFNIAQTIESTPDDNTQYLIIDDSVVGSGVVGSTHIIYLTLLETTPKVINISLLTNNNNSGNTLDVYIKDSNLNSIITVSTNGLRGISLMWDLTRWVIISNNLN